MKNLTEEIRKQYSEIKTELIEAIITTDVFENMSEDEYRTFKSIISFMNNALELTIKQAMMIDEMNEKLDKLLSKSEGA